ncbi:MAG: efflux RND transporter periplasmic adaptor subunit [Gammaproteobacteria bacterium]|nr:MAG: efflux RND transporter periplasmic adaptor subunit [Gammaproteobacteria bacterium]
MSLLLILLVQATPAADLVPISREQRQALGVTLAPLQKADAVWGPYFPGRIAVPNDQIRVVSATLPGLLTAMKVAEGEPVARGQVLAILQSPQLLELQRNLLQALTRLDVARAELERARRLHREGIIAERRYLEARSTHTIAQTEVEQWRQSLLLAGFSAAELERLVRERRLSGTIEIDSPLDGVVLEQLATPGQRLDALAPIYRIGRLDRLWVEVHVPLDELHGVAQGTLIELREPRLSGRVITIGRMVHGADQGILVRAVVEEGVDRLFPGQFVESRLRQQEEGEGLYRLPRSALVREGDRSVVFVVRDEGFEAVAVEPRAEDGEYLIISGDLQPDDQVAVSGTAAIKAAWLEARS